MKPPLTKVLAFFGSLIALSTLQYQHLQVLKSPSDQLSNTQAKQQETITSLRLSLLNQLPTLGFRNLVSDWTLLNFIQYFGESEHRELIGYSLAPDFFDIIIDRDPLFFGAYLYLTNTVSVYAGQPLEAIHLMEKGLNFMTPTVPKRSFFVWRYKGTDEMLFLGDNNAAQKSFETAASWAEQSDDNEAALVARLSQQTAAFLATDPNSKPALINGWMNVLSRAIDDNLRQEAIEQLAVLGAEVLIAQDGQVTVRYRNEE